MIRENKPIDFSDKIILIDKPKGWTSAAVINFLKKKFKIKKAGHSGTLDPKASGLLVVCTGKMTKKIGEMIEYDKDYEGVFRIGATTVSYDSESPEENIIEDISVNENDILTIKNYFIGEIFQIPPMHSAIKHKGKPLYKLARKGLSVEIKPRKVKINSFDVKLISKTEVEFFVSCSKGTYIRSLARDFGEKLGIGSYLKELKRLRIGPYYLKDIDGKIEHFNAKVL